MADKSFPVLFGPLAERELTEGIDALVRLIRPTLGPLPRCVLASPGGSARPTLLDSAGLIARRAQGSSAGFALLRQGLIRQLEVYGDGGACAAVMAQVAYHFGRRYTAAGGNPMRLRAWMERGLEEVILPGLAAQSQPIRCEAELRAFTRSACREEDVAHALGEIFDVIGEWGRLEILPGRSRSIEREFIDGMYWRKGMVSPQMATRPGEALLENPAVVVSNYYVSKPEPVRELMETAVAAGYSSLLFIATGFAENVVAMLVNPANREKLRVVAVEPPGAGAERMSFIEDIAVLTGAQPVYREKPLEDELVFPTVRNLRFVRPGDFGQARRAWVTAEACGLAGGKGDPRYLRNFVAELKRRLAREEEPAARFRLMERIARFMGGAATLWIGASSPIEAEQFLEAAETASRAARAALRGGTIPGGGTALLNCQPLLEARACEAAASGEMVDDSAPTAYRILARMVSEPARCIAANAGANPEVALAESQGAGPGYGFDAMTRRVRFMREAGILEATEITQAAARTAVSAAVMALTTGVVVRRR